MRIFIGYDKNEKTAAYVLAHSIQRRASIPVSFTFLNRKSLEALFDRPRGEFDSTDFSISRFLVPCLSDYQGWSLFMDCDMLCLGDIARLAGFATLMDTHSLAVRVVKHKYTPSEEFKFLGQVQTKYERKNWSSVMLFNNALCRSLTPEYVNKAPGLALHRFEWVDSRKIGTLPPEWNYLIGEENQCPKEDAKLLHYTKGGPWFPEYKGTEFADLWEYERGDMLES